MMKPKFLAAEPDTAGKDRRIILAEWLASPSNPYFATNLANIVWAHFFGRASSTKSMTHASNPASIRSIGGGQTFTDYKYDFKSWCVIFARHTLTNWRRSRMLTLAIRAILPTRRFVVSRRRLSSIASAR